MKKKKTATKWKTDFRRKKVRKQRLHIGKAPHFCRSHGILVQCMGNEMLATETPRTVCCVRSSLRQSKELERRETGARFGCAGDIQALDPFSDMISLQPFSLTQFLRQRRNLMAWPCSSAWAQIQPLWERSISTPQLWATLGLHRQNCSSFHKKPRFLPHPAVLGIKTELFNGDTRASSF